MLLISNMKYLALIFSLLLVTETYTQEFVSLKSRTQIRGIAETKTELLFYGEGIIWTDKKGNVVHQDRLLQNLPSSSIIDLQIDSEGNAWVLTANGIGLIRSQDDMQSVFEHEYANGETYQLLHIDNKGLVYTATKNHIYKINPDLTKSIVYSNKGKELSYIKRLLVDKSGNLIFTEFRNLFIVKPTGELLNPKPKGRVDYKHLVELENGTIVVMAFKRMFHLANDELVEVLKSSDLVNGLKFYDSEFASSEYYAILCNEGNLFINKNGDWTNYVPPTNLRPGNYQDDILLATDGQIWITMTEDPLLHFNGVSWKQIQLIAPSNIKEIYRNAVLADGRRITQDVKTFEFYEYKNDSFQSIHIKETERLKDIKSGNNEEFYWATKLGLNKSENGKTKQLIKNQEVNSFGVLKDKIILSTENLIQEYKNGTLTDISSQDHFLGADSYKYVKIYQTFKNELILVTNRKRGQLSLYDGDKWTKIIDIEGKKIGTVKNMITWKDKTYIFTETNGIALYTANGMKWFAKGFDDPNKKMFSNYVCKDGSVWTMDNKGSMHFYKDGKHLEIEEPIKNLYTNIRAIINTGEGQYDIYANKDILRCSLK